MSVKSPGLVVGLVLSASLWGGLPQDKNKSEPASQDQQQEQQKPQDQREEKRPTLGAPTEPSLGGGPRTSTTNDPKKLLHVQKIFVESIDNFLSDKLAADLAKLGRFRLVATRNEADAVLRGTCLDSRRLRSVHSEVYLNDRISGVSIWQDVVRRPFNPPALPKAVEDTAAVIVAHLSDSIQEAQHK